MSNLKIYCLSLNPLHLNLIKDLGYCPAGLGKEIYSKEWLTEESGENITLKNQYYAELSFHYWLWKNNKINFNGWIGFCGYRKFWKKNYTNSKIDDFEDLNNIVLKEIPKEMTEYETILGEDFFINQFRFSKFVKNNFKVMVTNPSLFFNKNKRTVKFHFDMMHGHGNLDKAIQMLPKKDKEDFKTYVNTEVSFSPFNMFICKNKETLFSYYESLFTWLFDCEKIFGFKDLHGYGLKRIYAFLAERYMSYWFKKYTKFIVLPIHFKDIGDYLL